MGDNTIGQTGRIIVQSTDTNTRQATSGTTRLPSQGKDEVVLNPLSNPGFSEMSDSQKRDYSSIRIIEVKEGEKLNINYERQATNRCGNPLTDRRGNPIMCRESLNFKDKCDRNFEGLCEIKGIGQIQRVTKDGKDIYYIGLYKNFNGNVTISGKPGRTTISTNDRPPAPPAPPQDTVPTPPPAPKEKEEVVEPETKGGIVPAPPAEEAPPPTPAETVPTPAEEAPPPTPAETAPTPEEAPTTVDKPKEKPLADKIKELRDGLGGKFATLIGQASVPARREIETIQQELKDKGTGFPQNLDNAAKKLEALRTKYAYLNKEGEEKTALDNLVNDLKELSKATKEDDANQAKMRAEQAAKQKEEEAHRAEEAPQKLAELSTRKDKDSKEIHKQLLTLIGQDIPLPARRELEKIQKDLYDKGIYPSTLDQAAKDLERLGKQYPRINDKDNTLGKLADNLKNLSKAIKDGEPLKALVKKYSDIRQAEQAAIRSAERDGRIDKQTGEIQTELGDLIKQVSKPEQRTVSREESDGIRKELRSLIGQDIPPPVRRKLEEVQEGITKGGMNSTSLESAAAKLKTTAKLPMPKEVKEKITALSNNLQNLSGEIKGSKMLEDAKKANKKELEAIQTQLIKDGIYNSRAVDAALKRLQKLASGETPGGLYLPIKDQVKVLTDQLEKLSNELKTRS